ncbi:MAG: AmmeMemoRadiSam system radical SAM enzyme [Candidatus Riflebacteria bacterium]|nr:AmmeMemoRadiSam system radical SAM enzyme [Candidatus Riflebacteria bacterium]
MKKAVYAENFKDYSECNLCPHHCRIYDNGTGRCLSRKRLEGALIPASYGVITASNLDPVEKKPLYHFFPGSNIFSVGSYGCNLRCTFCQNHDISQNIVPGNVSSPSRLAETARRIPDNIGIAFTYNEPGIWFEFVSDTAAEVRSNGQKVVLITNGFLSDAPWKDYCNITDAMNIDIKAFSSEFYTEICQGELSQVKRNIETAVSSNVHVELTNLIIPGKNDNSSEFSEMVSWIAGISPKIPLHISRYFPRFHETAPATDPKIINELYRIAKGKLNYVYIGNMQSESGHDSCCPVCGSTWVERVGYSVEVRNCTNKCSCGFENPIRLI